jgi:hypothetical protein
MRHAKLATPLLVTFAIVFVASAPASAINVPGCGDYLIYADKFIGFESGPLELTGDIIARDADSTVLVGANNVIHGSVTAANLSLGTNTVVDVCNTNNKTGPGTCGVINPFAPPAACTFPPLPVPTFPMSCSPGTVVFAQSDQTLAPGCYAQIRVDSNVTLTLEAGQTYFVVRELRQLTGSTVQSDTPNTAANVVIKESYFSQASAVMRDLNIIALAGPGASGNIGNANILENVLFYTPGGQIHPHTGTSLRGTTDLVAVRLRVQAITNNNVEFCKCPPGFLLGGPPQICVKP